MKLATPNSWVFEPGPVVSRFWVSGQNRRETRWISQMALKGFLALCVGFFAWIGSAAGADFAATAQRAFDETRSRYQADPSNGQAAWQFARACFDRADYATNSSERAEIAELGIAACRQLIARESNSAPGHYYLGMNLGQLAQTKGIGALKLVDQMEREFSIVRDLDRHLDFAGPDRNLGLLYRDAPAIASIGSRRKAQYHLQCAQVLAPAYPENGLNLIEAYLKWSDRNGVRRELKGLENLWPSAHTNLEGAAWAPSWVDWEKRYKAIKRKVEDPPKAIESPRQKE